MLSISQTNNQTIATFTSGLTVDWIGRKLYWADSKNDKMYVSELNGTYQKTLIAEDLTNPRAVAAHPLLG